MFLKRSKQPADPAAGRRHAQVPPTGRARVFSYYANRSARQDASERLADQPEDTLTRPSIPRNTRSIYAWIIAGVVVIALGLNMRLSSEPRIVILGDTSNHIFLQSTQVYAQETHTLLSGSIMDTNKITINASHVAEQLHNRFPELDGVSVALPFIGTQPTVYLLPATPQLVLQDISGHQFLLDVSGRALAGTSADASATSLDVPLVADQSGLPIHVGQLALPNSSVAFITDVSDELQAEHVSVALYTLPGDGASELDVRVAGEPYYVKFNLHGNARVEVGDFLAVKQQLDQSHKTPAQYIDVRVDGRAYYL